MVAIKSYTNIEQSKKLAEILPLESADMGWYYTPNPNAARNQMYAGTKAKDADIPCWSLAALLDILPNGIVMNKDSQNGKYHFSSMYIGTYVTTDDSIDACYEMILTLHEQKLL